MGLTSGLYMLSVFIIIHIFSLSTPIACFRHQAPLPSSLGQNTFARSGHGWLILISRTKWEFGYYHTYLLLCTEFNKKGLLLWCHLSLVSCHLCFSPLHFAVTAGPWWFPPHYSPMQRTCPSRHRRGFMVYSTVKYIPVFYTATIN